MKTVFIVLAFVALVIAAPSEDEAKKIEDTHIVTDLNSSLIAESEKTEDVSRVKKAAEQGKPKTVCFEEQTQREGTFLNAFT